MAKDLLKITNPHSVLAAIRERPTAVKGLTGRSDHGHWKEIREAAQKNRIKLTDPSSENGAWVEPKAALTEEELFALESKREPFGMWVILDCLHDPHNVGAIFRTANFLGARGVLLTEERSAPLSSTVYDTASGAMEYLPFAFAGNLSRAIRDAKDNHSVWVLGTTGLTVTHENPLPFSDLKWDRNWAVAFGNEEKGLRRLTMDLCDQMVTIPPASPSVGSTLDSIVESIDSLNVSVAVGIMLSALRFRA